MFLLSAVVALLFVINCELAAAADVSEVSTDKAAAIAVASEDTGEDDPSRIKRQHENGGKAGILSSLFSGLINKKLGLFGSLSSTSSSSSSSSSSSKGTETHYDTPNHPPLKPFDWWTFKKTILASLLQAVKAITGGVIALNGQLVKVKGHLLAAKGHLLSHKGDAITAFGRHLATNAFGAPHETHETHEIVHDQSSLSLPPPSAPSASLPSSSGFGSAPDFGISGPGSTYGGSLVPGFKNEYISAVDVPAGFYPGSAHSYRKKIESRQVPSISAKSEVRDEAVQGNIYSVKSVQEEQSVQPVQRLTKVKPIVVRSVPPRVYGRTDTNEEQQPIEYVPDSNILSNNIERQLEPEEYSNFGERRFYKQYYQG